MLKVKHVSYYKDHTFLVELDDGSVGYFDVFPYTDKGIFTQLKDTNYLKSVKINFCGIFWPSGQDFSADTIVFDMQHLPKTTMQRTV